jgi:hypothetical protein
MRARPQGHPEVIAQGYEYPVAMSHKVDGQIENWSERRLGMVIK